MSERRDYTIVPVLVSDNTSHVINKVSFDESLGNLTIKRTVLSLIGFKSVEKMEMTFKYGFINDKCYITQYSQEGQANFLIILRRGGRRLISKYWSGVIPKSEKEKMDRWFKAKKPYYSQELIEYMTEWDKRVREWKESLKDEAHSGK